jgi:hypothetical protein
MQFYDAIRNWRRIKPQFADVEFNRILIEDFNKYTYGRWREPFPAEGWKIHDDLLCRALPN